MSALDRTNPLPLWAQLLAELRQRIADGDYDGGFPTDAELSAEFGLSRHTVRDALRRLQDDGTITRRRGIGTVVSETTIEQPCGALYSLFRSIEARGREQRSDVIDLSIVRDPMVSARLGLADGDELVRLERLRRVDGEPLAHDVAWLPATIARPLLGVDFGHTALYDELARTCGIRPDAGVEWIRPVLPSAAERKLLGMRAGEPAYRIERLGRAGGVALEWRQSLVRADRYTFVAEWSGADRYEPGLVPATGA